MDTLAVLKANDITLGEFKPHTALFVGMSEFSTLTKDTTTITCWHGLLHVEHVVTESRELVGFNIVNANTFSSRFMPHILLQALVRDLTSTQHNVSPLQVFKLYTKALGLLLNFPKTWKVA